MTIRCEITKEDYKAFLEHISRTNSDLQRQRLQRGIVLLFTGTFAAAIFLSSKQTPIIVAGFFGIIAGVVLTVVLAAIIFKSTASSYWPLEDGYMFGEQETIIEDEGIRVRTKYSDALYKWQLVGVVGITATHAFVMLDRIAGIIVPKRCLSCDEEFDEFVREVQARAKKSGR